MWRSGILLNNTIASGANLYLVTLGGVIAIATQVLRIEDIKYVGPYFKCTGMFQFKVVLKSNVK